jgi:[ribosomal protein S5]-alanine N-acetyltransferase
VRGSYFLTTPRLGFRQWTDAGLPLAVSLWSDPEVTRLIGGPLSEEAVAQKLADDISSMNLHGVQYWPLFYLVTEEFAGCAGLRPYQPKEKIYELGFHLRPAFWRQGLAEEAGRAVIAYAFETIQARSLFAGHHPANAASRRVLEKLGFLFTHEELYPPTGLKHPSYSLAPASPRS